MPMYVYKCDECGHHFEQLQKFSDKPLKTCPRCKGHVKRVIHPTGIVFKGSGLVHQRFAQRWIKFVL